VPPQRGGGARLAIRPEAGAARLVVMIRDAIVVGAGLSGLVCARRLIDAGADAMVIEARPRVGGRLWNGKIGFMGVKGSIRSENASIAIVVQSFTSRWQSLRGRESRER